MKAILSYYLHTTNMTLECVKDTYGNKDTTVTLTDEDEDQLTILIQTVVEVDPENPEKSVSDYETDTAENLEIFTLAWCGCKYSEEDRDALDA